MTSCCGHAVTALPRGGHVVNTKAGGIQFIIPPETIKDAMVLNIAPEHYVFPDRRFDKQNGINLAEFEFPAYFSFFFKKRQIHLICSKEGEKVVRDVFQETLFGPEAIDPEVDFAPDFPKERRPDLAKELAHFRRNPFNPQEMLQIDTLIRFTHFDEETGIAEVGEGVQVVSHNGGRDFEVVEDGVSLAMLAAFKEAEPVVMTLPKNVPNLVFTPPDFGVTMLGTSHGFDPAGSTTGLVLWINGRGVIVDPPANSGVHLRNYHVPSALIDGIILTHCHADHDAGTFQKVLEEGKVMVMTTTTIKESFVRKYSSLTGLPQKLINSLFTFKPAVIGARMPYRGGEFSFHYSLHSIPCIGFTFHYQGKKIVFSGDTCNDPPRIQSMHESGVLSEGRAKDLLDFQWDADLILHEAGVPPLHTPCSTFLPLPQDVKERLYLVHIAAKDVPVHEGLKAAVAGIEHTLVVNVRADPNKDAVQLLDLLSSLELFKAVPLGSAAALLTCANKRCEEAGGYIVKQGDKGDSFCVIFSGEATLEMDGKRIPKTFTAGDYFGEISIFEQSSIRTASIVAVTDCVVYEFHGANLLNALEGTPVVDRLQKVAMMRQEESWNVISLNRALGKLSSSQKTHLQSLLIKGSFDKGSTLWRCGEQATRVYLLAKGSLAITGKTRSSEELEAGALAAEHVAVMKGEAHGTTLTATTDANVYIIHREDFLEFVADNPCVAIAVWDDVVVR